MLHKTKLCLIADLSHEFRIPSVCDVILTDISVQPVAEVQVSVIQGYQDIRDQT